MTEMDSGVLKQIAGVVSQGTGQASGLKEPLQRTASALFLESLDKVRNYLLEFRLSIGNCNKSMT